MPEGKTEDVQNQELPKDTSPSTELMPLVTKDDAPEKTLKDKLHQFIKKIHSEKNIREEGAERPMWRGVQIALGSRVEVEEIYKLLSDEPVPGLEDADVTWSNFYRTVTFEWDKGSSLKIASRKLNFGIEPQRNSFQEEQTPNRDDMDWLRYIEALGYAKCTIL